MVVAGVLGGALIGTTISYMLVKVLTGIFDPAPAAATSLGYLTLLIALVAGVTSSSCPGSGGWLPVPDPTSCGTSEPVGPPAGGRGIASDQEAVGEAARDRG